MLKLSTALLSGALLVPWLAHADTITFNFTGTITQVPIDDVGTGIQPLDLITGSFTFDSAAIDAIPAPTSASYTSSGPAYGMTATIGAVTFSESGFLNIGILNASVDQYTVTASSPTLTMDLFFQDSAGATFASDGLPSTPPPLAAFLQREFHLDETDIGGNETQADGIINSLTCGSGCVTSSVPEPSSGGLLFTGALLLAGLLPASRRRPKNSRTK